MAKASRPKILVAMPAYNEEKYIGSMVLKVRQYADEVLVIDDGSTDRTSEIAKYAGAEVIRHEQNRGKGSCIQTLLIEAKRKKTDVLVLLDADYQHNPDEIPDLVKPILVGADLVIGSRELDKGNIPPYRRIGQKVLSHFSFILSKKTGIDSECGFRALSPKAIAELKLSQKGFAIETEMIAAATERGLKITQVPIAAVYTKDGSTLNPLRHGFGVLGRILVMISERRPLLFFGILGVILVILGFIASIRVITIAQAGGGVAMGTALVSTLLLVIGVLSMFTGIILNALARRRE